MEVILAPETMTTTTHEDNDDEKDDRTCENTIQPLEFESKSRRAGVVGKIVVAMLDRAMLDSAIAIGHVVMFACVRQS